MATRDEIRRVKRSTEGGFIQRAGITGIATGYKVVGGVTTDEFCIRFYVAKKRTVSEKERIPKTIDGVKTDVIQRRYVAHPLKVRLADLKTMADTGRYDPLRGGISIGPCRALGGYIFVGTLGCIVRDNSTSDPMALSNYHVMALDTTWSVGDTMAQPSRVDGGNCPADVFGALQRAVLQGTTGTSGPGVDCAVSSITDRSHQCSIVDIGNVAGIATASVGMAVRKRGRTSALTHGTIDSIDLSVNIDYGPGIGVVTLIDQIGIEVDTAQSTTFGLGGDSGSAVVEGGRRVVGLYFGGNEEETDGAGNVIVAEGVYGVANPIQAVLDALDIGLCVSKLIKIEKPEKLEKFEKFEKVELKEFKREKFEKPELKEVRKEKFEKPELKELKREKPEIWEPKFDEPKRLEPKFDEPKFVEPKFDEPKYQEPPPIRDPLGPIKDRIGQLEQAVGQLSHFIHGSLRPDLSSGALKNEPDLQSGGQSTSQAQLAKLNKEAKETKDAKDTSEKPRDGWSMP